MIWIVFAVMTALALAGLIAPLMRPAAPLGRRLDYDMAVFRDQLDEVGRDVERGLLSPEQAESARTEIQRRMLFAADADAQAPAAPSAGSGRLALVIALGVPVFAFAAYGLIGSPTLPDQPYSGRAAQIAELRAQIGAIEQTMRRLEETLKADPGDGGNWAMLGRSLRILGRIEPAKEAFRKAIALLPNAVEPRVEYAGLLIDEAQGLSPEAIGLLREVLVLDPDQMDALFFVAQAEMADGHTEQARVLLGRLAGVLPPGSGDRAEIEQMLERLK